MLWCRGERREERGERRDWGGEVEGGLGGRSTKYVVDVFPQPSRV
ncbi:hypothetical protein PVAG01_06808 [Phlyctema vagabunda]|uniref:Uncharacterized protein n=1 Tax=Phlyctema vagabunda TaxID=108571 RepID=A0ABR4PH39_9HELO